MVNETVRVCWWIVLKLVIIGAIGISHAAHECAYGESRVFVPPHCLPPNVVSVTLQNRSPLCGTDYCYLLFGNDTCPAGTRRSPIKTLCIDECQPPKIKLRAKPYCVTLGCEDENEFAFCASNQLVKVLDAEDEMCPAGSERGIQRHVCFDEARQLDTLCAPGDRDHEPAKLPSYCVPSGFEEHLLAPLQRLMPICSDGKPCLQLSQWMATCPAGMELGKRQLLCSIQADITMCMNGIKTQVMPYCYPDTSDFHYAPYCDAKSCIHTNALTADCPPTMLKGPIRSFCAAPTCPADQIIRVQPYCEIIDRPSYLVNTNGTILCGHDAKPCLTPNALTGACPPGTRPGGLRDVCEQKSIMDFVPFTIRLMARPFCTSYPLFTQFSSFSLQNPFCGPSQLCHFLNSTSDECPPGMFRGDHKVVYVPDPDASECPSGYTGLPPFCMPYVGFGGATPDMINPNVIKSLIG